MSQVSSWEYDQRKEFYVTLYAITFLYFYTKHYFYKSLRKLRVSLQENINSKIRITVRSKQYDSTQAVSLCGPFCGHQDNKVPAYGFPLGLQMFLS